MAFFGILPTHQPFGDFFISSSAYSSLPGSWYSRNTFATGRFGATAQRNVAGLSMIASSSFGQSRAWILTGRSFSSDSSSEVEDFSSRGGRFFGAAAASSLPSITGPLRFLPDGGAAASPPPPPC